MFLCKCDCTDGLLLIRLHGWSSAGTAMVGAVVSAAGLYCWSAMLVAAAGLCCWSVLSIAASYLCY
jgi:hypothetical protein